MPELPEVETVVRVVRPRVVGRAIVAVPHAAEQMACSRCGPFAEMLAGRAITALRRHGKWLFFDLADDLILVIHLGMTGRLAVVEQARPLEPHTHLRLFLSGIAEELRFRDPRRFGELLLLTRDQAGVRFGSDRLGADALRVTQAYLVERLGKTGRAIKAALLDQRLLAGIGNIYADEILFAAGIHPARPANSLSFAEIARVRQAKTRILRCSIHLQGTSFRDYRTATGEPGQFQDFLNVYGRANLPCRKCGTAIALNRTVVSGRATCCCPRCQPLSPR